MEQQWNRYITAAQRFSPEAFRHPDPFFGPVYSWIWNAPLEEDTIRAQIDEMAEAGIRAFYIIPEPPEFRPQTMITTMTPAYLSPAFFRLVRLAVSYGGSKGMIAWLYDEAGWPSGSACGQLVKIHPALGAKYLSARTVSLPAGHPYVPGGEAVGGFIGKQSIAAGSVFDRDTTLTEYYRKTTPGSPLPDLTEPGTAEAFLELTHERYWQTLEGSGIHPPCMFTDEPLSAMPIFPRDFEERFLEEYGYSIAGYLYVLFDNGDLTPEEAAVRQDYGMLAAKLLNQRFFEPMRAWCRAHGMLLTGHIDRDHAMAQTAAAYGNPLAVLRTLDLPGIDAIWHQIKPDAVPVSEGESFFPRLAASAAAQSGHVLSLSESFAVYGNGLTPAQMRWVANYQFVRGIQILNPMTIPYGRADWLAYGERPYFCREIPGFTHLKQWNQSVNRVSWFMSCGLPVTDCALYLPLEEMWQDRDTARAAVEAYHAMGEALEQQGVDFDILDREALLQGEVKNGALRIGSAVYHQLYVPAGISLSPEVSHRVSQLDGKRRVFASTDCPDLKVRCRAAENGEWYLMVFCQSTCPVTGSVTLDTDMTCYRADPDTGKLWLLKRRAVERPQRISLTLEAGEACLILVSPREYPCEPEIPLVGCVICQPVACTQTAEFRCDADGIHREETRKPLPVKEAFRDMVGAAFSGEICYRFRLHLTAEDLSCRRFALTAERVEHTARVQVNGRDAGFLIAPPYTLELDPGLLREGENDLELTVANTAANRYAATDASAWFDDAHIGPYHARAQAFEAQRRDGGLYGSLRLIRYGY